MASRLKGNQFWKLHTKHGRDKIFSDPALLWSEATLYFEYCDGHPWLEAELVKYKGGYKVADLPKGCMYSMDGLTRYLRVSGSYFRSAKGLLREKIEKGRATASEIELLDTIELIEQTIRTQQIEGAAAGIFPANLVSRLNGLADNTNVSNSGEAVVRVTVRDQETADYLNELDELL